MGRHGIGFGKGLLYGILVIAVCAAKYFLDPSFTAGPLNSALTIVIFLIWMPATGMTEEFECRAVMAETPLAHFGTDCSGILKAVFISAVLFGAMHLMGMTGGADPVGILGRRFPPSSQASCSPPSISGRAISGCA
jgi:membrane protease YdiL (CAAX protease family)